MAIQDYVRSIAATETVSKDQVFRFLEMQFARADKNHDGKLDSDELEEFARAVSCPESDQR
jgi:Ca2+-binding EF-hand superfamily protein